MPTNYSFPFDVLPDDVFDEIKQSLLGWDLFRLSHASSWLHTTLSPQEIWQERVVAPPEPVANAKKYYVQARSLCFLGQRVEKKKRSTRCSGVEVPIKDIIETASSVTISTWFSLLPPTDGVYTGGIILGAQSVHQSKAKRWADCHQQFILVDTERNLYCSVLGTTKKPVATNLQCNRWYHLALTYINEIQQVYLDGQLVSIEEGSLHHEMWYLWHSQVGTGCISGNSVGEPDEGLCGWYGFHGVVHDFRAWSSALSAEELKRLARGEEIDTPPSSSQLHNQRRTGPVKYLRTSSPLERVFVPTPAAT